MNNPVGWFEIYVNDMPRARGFYEAVFGFTMTQLPNPGMELWAFPSEREGYGAAGALVKMEGFGAGGNSVLVYFMCEDCATEAGRVEAAGGGIVKPKMPIGDYGFITLVTDTEGNLIGLHSMK